MRQPLEDGTVCIARASMSLTFPARFMLVAAMNPCPCGFHNDRTRECHCTPPMIQRYISKISGPLLDCIDIHIDVPAVNYKEMRSGSEPESSSQIRDRVMRTRHIQLEGFAKDKIYCNAQMAPRQLRTHCDLSAECEKLLERAMTQQGAPGRMIVSLKWRGLLPICKELVPLSPSTLPRRFNIERWIERTGSDLDCARMSTCMTLIYKALLTFCLTPGGCGDYIIRSQDV
jgi:hypothetical protein